MGRKRKLTKVGNRPRADGHTEDKAMREATYDPGYERSSIKMNSFWKFLPSILLIGALGALIVAWPYLFPEPTVDSLAQECTVKCARFNKNGNLKAQEAPYSPKASGKKFSCDCG
jgi:hypothetical protein